MNIFVECSSCKNEDRANLKRCSKCNSKDLILISFSLNECKSDQYDLNG